MTKNFKLTSSIYKLKITEVIYINMKTRRQKSKCAVQIHTDQYFVSFTFNLFSNYLKQTKYTEQTQPK